jgi:hypothetical protein
MHRALALLLAVTLTAAFPAAAQPSALGAYCGAGADVTGPDCCPNPTAATDCQSADCAGSGAALPVALPERGYAPGIADSPRTPVTQLIAPPARAPDTAPPKPVV